MSSNGIPLRINFSFFGVSDQVFGSSYYDLVEFYLFENYLLINSSQNFCNYKDAHNKCFFFLKKK